MESQLRRGAAFCRRVAVVALVVGFAGSMAVGVAFERYSAAELSPQAVLAIMSLSILAVLLFVCLLFMVARALEGLANLYTQTAQPTGMETAAGTGGACAPRPGVEGEEEASGAGAAESESALSPASAAGAPDLAAPAPSSPEIGSGRPAGLAGVVETIRLGRFVKVRAPDGWTGWVEEVDLPRPAATSLPRTAAGAPYRPPGPSLTPGGSAGPHPEDE
jgi:hypothetical protein